jgi:hypothetical protein
MESIKVKLVAVNVEERKIDFVPVERDDAAQPQRRGRRRRG